MGNNKGKKIFIGLASALAAGAAFGARKALKKRNENKQEEKKEENVFSYTVKLDDSYNSRKARKLTDDEILEEIRKETSL